MIYDNGYLSHHGIKGQKWGVRRYQNPDGSLTTAGEKKLAIKEAKKELKATKKQFRKENNSIWASREAKAKADKTIGKVFDAEHKLVDKKADYAKFKGGEKAEMRQYIRAMKKTGLSGSYLDAENLGAGTKLYDHIATTKGKEYAKKIEKRAKTETLATIGTGMTLMIGLAAVQTYLDIKKGS